jgi:hypothetical protein
MKIFVFCLLLFVSTVITAQSLKKYDVPEMNGTVYMFCAPKWDADHSEDTSKVFTAECKKDDVSYGAICIRLLHPIDDMNLAEQMLIDYLNYLKLNFDIKSAVGYGRTDGNSLGTVRGIIDYWTDRDNNNWKIKGVTNGKVVAVLYGYSSKQLNEPKINVFLNSFEFRN